MEIKYNKKATEKNVKETLEANFPATVKYINEYDFVGGGTIFTTNPGLENVVGAYVGAAPLKIRTKGLILQRILHDCITAAALDKEISNKTLNAMREEYIKHFT